MLVQCATLLILALAAQGQSSMPVPTPNGIAPWPPLWPLPTFYSNGTDWDILIDPLNLTLTFNNATSPALEAAFDRFTENAFPHTPLPAHGLPQTINFINVFVWDWNAPLQLYVKENYTLSINDPTTVYIEAETIFGAYHALETLSQLIGFDFDNQTYVIRHLPWNITDGPRFPHRGVLLDSSRHFEPIGTIKQVIRSLAMAKFNTLHWHIVDAISFPYDSTLYPLLGPKTSYAPQERYTQNDVKDVVAYGLALGIRVMVELDTPGHSGSMCFAYPEICPTPACTSSNINNWALDISKNQTYDVIEALLNEFDVLFPEKMIHLGGDEVVYDCWEASPAIVQWLNDRGLSMTGGYEYYVKRIQDYVWAKFPDRLVMGWQEIWNHFGTALNNKTIIQQWLPDSTALPLNVTNHGYRLVWSDSSVWYLDHLAVTWQTMYEAEPCNGLPDANCELILGGEGCQWGETVDTSDALQTIWPRAAAIAERLWSPREYRQTDTALPRMLAFRCLLNARGIPAAPVMNTQARQAPPNPGSCFWQ